MYPEFIAIFVCFGILAVMQIVSLILIIVLLKRSKNPTGSVQINSYARSFQQPVQSNGVAFCLNCGTQFDAAHKVCPKCGKPR